MSGRIRYQKAARRVARTAMAVVALPMLLAACQPEGETTVPGIRAVRTVTVERRAPGAPITIVGRIEALDEASLGFRISGRVLENDLKLGEQVKPGQVLARLEPQNELNALRSAKADLDAAEGQLTRARNQFERQEFLLAREVVPRATFDEAKQMFQTAQSQVDAAKAQLEVAHDLVGFTELEADAPGVLTAVGARAGEVVQAGQMIARIARKGGRDAVFEVPAQLIRSIPAEPRISVSLTDDPAVTAVGRIREVAPQANPQTRTFEVRVGLTDPPAAMRLGASVTGRVQMDVAPGIEIPATALTESAGQPAVWIVDPSTLTVSLRKIEVQRHDVSTVAISQGLDINDIVVVAGVRDLHRGQKVRLFGSEL